MVIRRTSKEEMKLLGWFFNLDVLKTYQTVSMLCLTGNSAQYHAGSWNLRTLVFLQLQKDVLV